MPLSYPKIKKAIKHGAKTTLLGFTFFTLWAVLLSVVMANDSLSRPSWIQHIDALQRLWWEIIPAISLFIATYIFTVKDRGSHPILAGRHWQRESMFGFLVAAGWLAVSALPLILFGSLRFEGTNTINLFIIWLIAMAINAAMQEYLVRGYLFSLLTRRHSLAVAVMVTTLLFTLLHGFAGGVLGVLNVAAASLVFTLLLIRTGSLIAPIIAHITWNGIGGVILGVVNLGDVYPSFFKVTQHGSTVMTGGDLMLEGSIITCLVSVLIIFLLVRYGGENI